MMIVSAMARNSPTGRDALNLSSSVLPVNWGISKARALDGLQDLASPEAIAEAAAQSGCRSVAFTYNDPVIFLEYAVDVAQACRERGIKTVAVSAGYICDEPRAEFFQHMDAANIDLKGFTEHFYKSLCSAQLGPVLDTLAYLKDVRDHGTADPGREHSRAEIEALSCWVMERLGPDVPLHLSPIGRCSISSRRR